MIPLTYLEYESNDAPDKIINRLKWSVEEVKVSWLDRLNNRHPSEEATRKWIGKVDERAYSFSFVEPGSLFNQHLNVVSKGSLQVRASSTLIKIKVGLDTISFFWITAFYLMGAGLLGEAISNAQFESYGMLVFFLVGFPILGTFLIRRRMKIAESKLDVLFGP